MEQLTEKALSCITHTDEEIRGFFGNARFLSNFEHCPNGVEHDGLMYMSSEAAYQAAKIEHVQDRKRFTTLDAKESKREGRKLILRKDWDNIKDSVMYEVLTSKFSRNKGLKNMLLETGNKYLCEENYWGDIYWGSCLGEGENKLGKTLMRVRSELKPEKLTQLF